MPLVNTSLVHSGLVASLQGAGWYPSSVVIQEHDGAVNAANELNLADAHWADVSGLEALKGRLTPMTAGEFPQAGFVRSEATHLLALNGLYPAILPTMRAKVDGTVYAIDGPSIQSGDGAYTRLALKLVTT